MCACCSAKEREDELHIFFCDAYAGLRAQFSEVFEDELYKRLHDAHMNNADDLDECMNKFVNKRDSSYLNAFVGYLRKSIKVRDNLECLQLY